ncbi:hypothetical protein [Paenibacillus sp. MMO-177]|uniref:hypothetical protein n=1 Tax=Paenibacillus sp. MMO-177 TaxID=3081289 RepID=UPI0030170E8E
MSREFTMGIRLNYFDNDFTRGIREAARNTNGFRDSMRGASGSADGLIGKLGGLAAALGGIAVGKKAFDWLIGANADMEQYQNTLTVVMGSAEEATKTLAWANKFAAQTPFEIPQVVEATTRMSAYGISAQKTLGIVGDMASVMGKDLMQAVEAVADAQTGELERLKEFGITKKMIQDQAKALGANPIDSKGTITDMKAFNAALFSLMEKRFQGGMAMQAKSFKGMLSNAQDFMGTLGRRLGQPLFERAKAQLGKFLGTLNELQDSGTIDRFISNVHKAGTVVGNVFGYIGNTVAWAFGMVKKVSAPVFKYIQKNWDNIKPFVEGVAIAIGALVAVMGAMKTATMVSTVALRLMNAAMLTNPIGWLILALGLAIGLFIKMNGGIEGTKQKLAGWFSAMQAWYKSDGTQAFIAKAIAAFKQLAKMAGEAFAWLQAQAIKYWPTIKAVATVVITNLVNGFKFLVATAKKYWPAIKDTMLDTWNMVKTNILPAAKQLLTVVQDAFAKIWAAAVPLAAALYKFFKAVMPTIMVLIGAVAWAVTKILWPIVILIWKLLLQVAAAVIPVVTAIATSIMGAFTKVLNWFAIIWPAILKIITVAFGVIRFLWSALGPYIMAALQVIFSIISGALGVIMAVVKFVWNTICSVIEIAWAIISGIIQTALGILTGDWQMAWGGIKSIFEGIWNGIIDFLKGLGSLFYDSGKAIITTLVDGIKSMAMAPINAVKNILGEVRKFLPFSDAKKGPLSELTYSGGAVMTTLATGVNKKQGALQDAVSNAFAGTNLGLNVSATATGPQLAPAASFSAAPTNIAPTQVGVATPPSAKAGGDVNVGSLVGAVTIHQQPGEDADDLVDKFIDELYTRVKEAAAILTSADKEALI